MDEFEEKYKSSGGFVVEVDEPTVSGEAAAPTESGRPQMSTRGSAGGGAVYAIGLVGALVWFLGRAQGPKGYAAGVLKALVWPALLVYGAFGALSGSDHDDAGTELGNR